MACLGGECVKTHIQYFDSYEEEKLAELRNKQINKMLKEQTRLELKQLKILLLGTGESGKSTITKQMKIIHINGFDKQERLDKIKDIKKNIHESIIVILCAMQQLGIPLEREDNKPRMNTILEEACDLEPDITDDFLRETEILWEDKGVQECYSRSFQYQLIDSAKYFLDKIHVIRQADYIPSDQDILRCRVLTTSIQHIEFEALDNGNPVSFSVFDVGGQRGERRKWIQMFDSVVAILFLADCSSYDQTLREDRTENRFLEALEIFEQVWRNRFLKNVSILLFMNKMDILAEKVQKGRFIKDLSDKYPDKFPNYDDFVPSNSEKLEFLDSYNRPAEGDSKRRRGSRSNSKSADVNPDLIKSAVYIKRLFMKIVNGEIEFNTMTQKQSKDWHQNHSCEYFYTCAVDTNNIQRVLKGCRTLIIRKHLERFGII